MKNYIVGKNYEGDGIWGHLVIAKDTVVVEDNGILYYNGKKICYANSFDAFEFFSRNDDQEGARRFALVNNIKDTLNALKNDYVSKCEKIRKNYLLPPEERESRIAEIDDEWSNALDRLHTNNRTKVFFTNGVFNFSFYNASIRDLEYVEYIIEQKEEVGGQA